MIQVHLLRMWRLTHNLTYNLTYNLPIFRKGKTTLDQLQPSFVSFARKLRSQCIPPFLDRG